MKNIFFTLALMLVCFSMEAKEITSKTFLTNIDCPSCSNKIMRTLPYEKGVKDVKIDLQKRTIAVDFDKEKTTEEKIIETLKKVDVKVIK